MTQHERMEALGKASLFVAHEIKNSLNVLSVGASLLDPSGQTAAGRSVLAHINRLKHLANTLLQFGAPSSLPLSPVYIEALAQEVVRALQNAPEAEGITLTLSGHAPQKTPCHPELLASALDNLVRNALEACTEQAPAHPAAGPFVQVRLSQDSHTRIEVEDNGGGPPVSVVARLFEPFVSGKRNGIGLGLAFVKESLAHQGGSIRFERTAAGSRFVVELPLSSAPATSVGA